MCYSVDFPPLNLIFSCPYFSGLTALTLLQVFIFCAWIMYYPDLNPSLQAALMGPALRCNSS